MYYILLMVIPAERQNDLGKHYQQQQKKNIFVDCV